MMRNSKLFAVALVLLLMAFTLFAQTLELDKNGSPIQYGRSFTTLTQAATADTVWGRVTVPVGAYEVWVLASAGLQVSADSLYTSPARNITLSSSHPVVLPVLRQRTFYIRRAAAATAASAYMLFRRM